MGCGLTADAHADKEPSLEELWPESEGEESDAGDSSDDSSDEGGSDEE